MLDDRIRIRSFMFLPAHNKKFIDKAINSEADAIILDLEDGVPPFMKSEARENIITYSNKGAFDKRRNIFIRINPINSDAFIADIEEMTLDSIDGFMLSKIETEKDIEFIDRLLDFYERKKNIINKKFKLAPLIETTKALENIYNIAKSSDRLIALCLGGEDYLCDLGSVYTYQETALEYPRAILVNAARSNKLLPIDTPYLDIKDIDGFEKHQRLAYKNGFAGCLILNPCQIEVANKAFTPNDDTIVNSRRVVEAVKKVSEEGVSGVVMLDGTMVGPPMKKRAEIVLNQIGEI